MKKEKSWTMLEMGAPVWFLIFFCFFFRKHVKVKKCFMHQNVFIYYFYFTSLILIEIHYQKKKKWNKELNRSNRSGCFQLQVEFSEPRKRPSAVLKKRVWSTHIIYNVVWGHYYWTRKKKVFTFEDQEKMIWFRTQKFKKENKTVKQKQDANSDTNVNTNP